MKLVISFCVLFMILIGVLALTIGLRREGFEDMINVAKLQRPFPVGPTRCEACCYSGIETCDPQDNCKC
jgi:hypothetical protein